MGFTVIGLGFRGLFTYTRSRFRTNRPLVFDRKSQRQTETNVGITANT